MFTQRLFKVTVAVILVVAGLLAVRPFAKASVVPNSSGSSTERAAYEYHMHERYGEAVPEEMLAHTAAVKAAHEYRMHESYGESVPEDLLAQVAALKAAHEYRMQEWYGDAVPEKLLAQVAALKAARENRLREGP